ncbi:PQQ-binding-like beta-propeller repeat protein [Microbacterium sp. PMB16]|uniref:outer membrane protein assembly factor BamB family protein n=1 Tax=Microbacterium sp. PMB16 TaxID=3120157 RepID=UPI003F4BA496
MTRSIRSRVCAGGALVAALVLAGCTPGAEPDPLTQGWETQAAVAWTADDRLLSAPAVADGVYLAYVVGEDASTAMVARDLATGTELWRRPTFVGNDSPDTEHGVAVTRLEDGTWSVAVLLPTSGENAAYFGTFAALDLHSGESLSPGLSTTLLWGTRPTVCGDTFCVTAAQADTEYETQKSLMFDLADGGSLVPTTGADAPFLEGGQMLGTYVSVSDAAAGPEQLRYGRGGEYRWTRPYADVFGTGTTSAAGWAWKDAESDLPLLGVGLAFTATAADDSKPYDVVVDYGSLRFVALDPDSGDTVWEHQATAPCDFTTGLVDPVDGVLTLCRFASGSLSWHWNGTSAEDVSYDDFETDLIGVDAATGKVLWEVPFGGDTTSIRSADEGGTSYLAGPRVPMSLDGVVTLVDPKDGSLTPLPPKARLLCTQPAERPELIGPFNASRPTAYRLAPVLGLCASDGTRDADATVTAGTTAVAGLDDEDYIVLNLVDGVTALKPRD